MDIPESSLSGLSEASGSAAAPRTAERHERPPAHEEPDDVAGLVDDGHEAREVGDRCRALVAVGALERPEPAQVSAERRQHDRLSVHGCTASWTARASQIGGSGADVRWGGGRARGGSD